jgi:hypothetical protein
MPNYKNKRLHFIEALAIKFSKKYKKNHIKFEQVISLLTTIITKKKNPNQPTEKLE